MPALNRSKKVKCEEDCDKSTRELRQPNIARCVFDEYYLVRIVIIVFTTSKKWFSKQVRSVKKRKVNQKVNKVCILWEFPRCYSLQHYRTDDHVLKARKTSNFFLLIWNFFLENKDHIDQLQECWMLVNTSWHILRWKTNNNNKRFRCPTCDTFFILSQIFNDHLLRCKNRSKTNYLKNIYTLRQTLFEKLDGFKIKYTKEQFLFKKIAVFHFDSICIPFQEKKTIETITWIGEHEQISVSISSNLLEKFIFLCAKNPQSIIIDFVANMELLAAKIKRRYDQYFLRMKTRSKRGNTQFLMKEAFSIKVRQENTTTNVSRMMKKQTHPLTFSGFKKISWFIWYNIQRDTALLDSTVAGII